MAFEACTVEFTVSVRDPKYAVSDMSPDELETAIKERCAWLRSGDECPSLVKWYDSWVGYEVLDGKDFSPNAGAA